jgi:predicted transcriptional regulator
MKNLAKVNMKLKEFMKKNRYSARSFAQESGIHQSTIYRILAGKAVLFDVIVKIVEFTEDKVSYKDLAQELEQ